MRFLSWLRFNAKNAAQTTLFYETKCNAGKTYQIKCAAGQIFLTESSWVVYPVDEICNLCLKFLIRIFFFNSLIHESI